VRELRYRGFLNNKLNFLDKHAVATHPVHRNQTQTG